MDLEQPKRKIGCLRIFAIVLSTIVVVIVVLGLFGSLYQQQAKNNFFENNPAPGELVDVGGRSLHIHCVGTGSPTIVIDAGLGGWSIDIADLQAELTQTNQVCTYDRAGYGWSDKADDDRSLEAITTDLHTLLTNAEIDEPYILVGFSFSGLVVRHYYELYPESLVGLVLLDPAHEGDTALQTEEIYSAQQSLLSIYSTFEMAANVGLVRILDPAEIAPYAPFIPNDPASPELYYEGIANSNWWATTRKEFYTNQFADLPSLPVTFDIPVRIVGLSDSPPEIAELNEAHLGLLEQLADEDEDTELIVLDNIIHENLVNEVDIVATIIRELLADIEP